MKMVTVILVLPGLNSGTHHPSEEDDISDIYSGIAAGHAQVVVVYNTGGLPLLFGSKENSAETEQKYKNAEINLEKAYDAYEAGQLVKTKYYLDQSEKKGVVSP